MSWSSWHTFFVSSFFSSNFTDESEGILAYRISHGISRNFGRWPMARARYVLLLFFVTQISQMTQIFLCVDYFVPQISQIYTDFSLWGIISSHRFHRYTQIFLCGDYFVPQISQMTQIFLCGTYSNSRGYLHRPDRSPPWKSVSNCLRRKSPNKFRVIRWIKKICVICEICGTFSNLRGYLHRPNRSPLRKSMSNRLIRNTSE